MSEIRIITPAEAAPAATNMQLIINNINDGLRNGDRAFWVHETAWAAVDAAAGKAGWLTLRRNDGRMGILPLDVPSSASATASDCSASA